MAATASSTNPMSDPPLASGIPGSDSRSKGKSVPPMMYSMFVPGFIPPPNQEQPDHGPGIYAVASGDLIPITYTMPARSSSDGGAGAEQAGQAREQQGAQREVMVRRLQFGIQLDVFLIVKLMAVVILFNQDGSTKRLLTLLLSASLIYLHQTGALAPLLRWLQRQAAPPRPRPRPVARADNGPVMGREDGNGNAAQPEGQPGVEQENQPVQNGDEAVVNENQAEAERQDRGHWWGIAKEIQMFVIGFITSLLPGFHPQD